MPRHPRRNNFRTTLLCGVLLALSATAIGNAQSATSAEIPPQLKLQSVDFGFTYAPERSLVAQSGGNRFWFQGYAFNTSFNYLHGLGLAIEASQQFASNIEPNVNIDKFTAALGPRYTYNFTRKKFPARVYSEFLIGGAHAYNGIFTGIGSTTSAATTLDLQLGAGADLPLKHGFGLRLLEVDYVRTQFNNNNSGGQNDLRLGFGLSYHLPTITKKK